MRLSLAVAVLVCSIQALAQVSVVEPAAQAKLVDGHTTISLTLVNSAPKVLDANIRLRWLNPAGKVDGEVLPRPAVLAPGNTTVSVPLPFSGTDFVLADRLEYTVFPGQRNYTAFTPFTGILNFTEIADYAFTLCVVTAGIPRPGVPFEVRVLATHPLTGRPVPGVTVEEDDTHATAVTDADGVALLRVVREADDDNGSVDVTAHVGDIMDTANSTALPISSDTIHGYTDKPLYQPGQTMHVRILAVGGNGKAKAATEYEIRITKEGGDVLHSAKVTTSRFGIGATDWEIPPDAEAGRYDVCLKTEDSNRYHLRYINIRRYELPSFRVTTAPDKPFYLIGQPAQVEIRGEYLFGKPVAGGKVRIAAEGDEEKSVAEGVLDAEGRFRAKLDTNAEFGKDMKFYDRSFVAFLTDVTTNRTEQRKFDIRISREPVHIYAVRQESDSTGRRLYVSTYSPDGAPLRGQVEVLDGAIVLGQGQTNRFGLVRVELPAATDDEGHKLEIRVAAAGGQRARMEYRFYGPKAALWMRTNRNLYRAGETVTCAIGSSEADRQVLLVAYNERQDVVFTRSLRMQGKRAEVAIPYNKRFGRMLNIGVASAAGGITAFRRVYFPGPSELVLTAAPAKPTYRPGETANIRFQASAEAALGVAIVDQSVLERAATDAAFGRRSFFAEHEHEQSLGGVTQRDLLNLDPAKIDDELQLAAEVLEPNTDQFQAEADLPDNGAYSPFAAASAKALAPVQEALDQYYMRTLEYPRDEASFQRIAGHVFNGIKDPWLRSFAPRFSIEGNQAVLAIASAGPDRKWNTADDYTALTVQRKWFAEYERIIGAALLRQADFPASPEEFARVLEAAGIRFDALRDPWGSAMRVDLDCTRNVMRLRIRSAGPDRQWQAKGDFVVAEFSGRYFAEMEARIDAIIEAAPEFLGTDDEFRALLSRSGVDFDALRDPWGHAYYVTVHTDESFTDQVQPYTYVPFNGVPEERRQTTPIKQTRWVLEIRSIGEDGKKNSYDDFAIASFSRVRNAQPPVVQPRTAAKAAPRPALTGGMGTITGTVQDPSGGILPNVEVTLNDEFVTRTGNEGKYFFRGLPDGKYRISCHPAGFDGTVMEGIPATAGQVTHADLVLRLGTISEAVMVQAGAVMNLSMSMSSTSNFVRLVPGVVGVAAALSTPRVREYFPETLYWQPELVTDAAGRASLNVKLADSVTTWQVAVIGSTEDGRIAEGSADIRAFQPFLVDLAVPQVLTAKDEISLPVPVRNYLDREQKVAVTAKVPPELRLIEPVKQPGTVAPSSSASAVLSLRAEGMAAGARLRVTAVGGAASDAIEKPLAIHPDGERKLLTESSVVASGEALPLPIGARAIAGSITGKVKIYPSLVARILEAIEVLLEKPHGCGEQSISSTYPNLLLLRALKDAGLTDEPLAARARKNLVAGLQRLLNYQDSSGGFTYWGHGNPDAALTAYAIEFLQDAAAFLPLDEDIVDRAREWLAAQRPEGSAATALGLAALTRGNRKAVPDQDERLGALARDAARFGDPYAMAAYALAALEANKPDLAGPVVEELTRMAKDERGAAWWALRANTPYHGWGRSGQVETTALVVSALARWRKAGHGDAALNTLIDRGGLFLLRGADAGGAWATSQASVRALTALLDSWSRDDAAKAADVEVQVNGASAGKVVLPAGRSVRAPLVVDIARFLHPGANQVSLTGFGDRAQQVQWTAAWYEPWEGKRPAKEMDMEVRFSTLNAKVTAPVECDVAISRPSFRGYGMMIAEIGLPPGAEADRGVLEDLIANSKNGVDSYEVAPDRVTFYVWPRAADVKFRFLFRPRYAMKARAAASVLYDYYNPDERVVLVPERFVVAQ